MSGFNQEDTVIIVTSDEPWGRVMHTQLHYAFQLSKYYNVIFVNPPRVWNPASGFIDYKKAFRVNMKLLVIPYRHLFPVRFFRYFFTFLNDILTSLSIRKFLPVGKTEIVLWRFDHFRFYNFWLPKPVRTIYHVVDQYIGKPGDEQFSIESDLVVVTSPRLGEHYKKRNENVLLIPQCIPEEDNVVDPEVVLELNEKYGRYMLFIGTFSREVDIGLLDRLAKQYSDNNLLVIGPVLSLNMTDLDSLKTFQANPNVHFIGSIPGLELKNFISGAEICLVPYKFQDERSVHIRSPLKILNYISQKRPVVTSMDSELPSALDMGVFFVHNQEEFISKVGECLNKPTKIDIAAVDEYMKSVNYSLKIEEILTRLEDCSG